MEDGDDQLQMTVVEEIQKSMEYGANTMFLVGLISMYRNNPVLTMRSIYKAGEKVRRKREVKLKK